MKSCFGKDEEGIEGSRILLYNNYNLIQLHQLADIVNLLKKIMQHLV